MIEDIRNMVKGCLICRQVNSHRASKTERSAFVPKIFEQLSLDLMGPIDGFYIFVAVDSLSNYAITKIIPNKSAEEIQQAILKTIILIYGVPRTILSDNGLEFNNQQVEHLCKKFNIIHLKTPAYHPSSNGRVEKVNHLLAERLRKLKIEYPQHNWKQLLGYATFQYNATPQSKQVSPFFLTFGRTPVIPQITDFESIDEDRLESLESDSSMTTHPATRLCCDVKCF